jgi:cytochrome c oxidase subunit 3
MKSEQDPQKQLGAGRPVSAFGRIERLPPRQVVFYLALLAIAVMFVMLVLVYVRTRAVSGTAPGQHPFPRFFSLSTIVLLVSSYVLAQAPRLYGQDDLNALGRCLGASLLLGSVFAGLQVLGWRELTQQGTLFQGPPSGSFIYLISALHVVHLLGGMFFLLYLLLATLHADRDAVRELVFIRNPYRRRQLRMLGTYWHFIGVLWVGLFAVFLFLY